MSEAEITCRPMRAADYAQCYALWQRTPGMGLDPQLDSASAIAVYLEKNPGMSFVVTLAVTPVCEKIVGTVLAGTDGRRGYLMHLAVDEALRRRGIGRMLVEHTLAALREVGIGKAHVFIFQNNTIGLAFWRGLGWQGRDDLRMLSFTQEPAAQCC